MEQVHVKYVRTSEQTGADPAGGWTILRANHRHRTEKRGWNLAPTDQEVLLSNSIFPFGSDWE